MANTVEVRRLMRHAADLLQNSNPSTPLTTKAVRGLGYIEEITTATQTLGKATAAMCFAEALLRMVAAAMEDEPHADRDS